MLNIKGFPLWIIDTAGIKKTRNAVEKEGIARTRSKIKEADLILLLIDGSCPLSEEDRSIFKEVKEKEGLIAINKVDLPQKVEKEEIFSFFPDREIIEISATKEINIDLLKEKIANFILKKAAPSSDDLLVMNLRQKKALEEAKKSLARALEGADQGLSEELIAFELREGIKHLEEITGEVVADEILDRIFSRFCIGK